MCVHLIPRASMVIGQKLRAHHWHKGAGENERSEHGKANRQRQWAEQKSTNAGQQREWRKHNEGGARSHHHRHHDLRATINRCANPRLTHVIIAVVVLQLHNRLINQRSDRQGQSTKRHRVDGVPRGIQPNDGAHDSKRNGHGGNQRHAPVTQKQQNHDGNQHGAHNSLKHQ